MGSQAVLVNNSPAKTEHPRTYALDSEASTRSKRYFLGNNGAGHNANRKSLPWMRKNDPGQKCDLCSLCRQSCDRTARNRFPAWTGSRANSRSFGQTSGLSTAAFKGAVVMGRIQPTGMAHPPVVLGENSAATLERCDISHSIKPTSVPVVCEPYSPRLPPAS